MNTIELQVEGLTESISNVSESKLYKAIKAGHEILNDTASENDFESFYDVARAIVEPNLDDEISEDYHSFLENDAENWTYFISNNFGPDWGTIAQIVSEYGY